MRTTPLRALGMTALAALLLFALLMLSSPPPADAQVNVTGQWSTLPYLSPVNPIHVALLHNGKVLIVAGSENNQNNTIYKTAVWDPASGTFAQQTTPWDLFCNGMSFLPDGRVIMTGGNIQYDPFFGPPWTTIFDPATEKFYRVEDMAGGRWYPTNQLLNDGGTMTFGGLDETGATNTTVEIYDVGGGWTGPYPSNFTPGWYPRLHLLGNGKVFMSGPTPTSRTFNPEQGTWSATGNTTVYGGDRLYGSSVLLPLHPDDGYRPRVMIFGGNTNGATNTVEYIDLGTWPEAWVNMPPMSVPRVNGNAVLLPNGKILTFGGSTKFNDPLTAHYNAETFDPASQTWTPSGTMAYHRLYHSSTLLLPDGTVWVAGSNPNRSTWTPQMEIYKPPYLFTSTGAPAPRPTISSVPAKVGYGQTFTVGTPDASKVTKVMLMRPGSNTHAFDSEQRLIYTYFTKGTNTLTVTAPTSTGAAPPGYYMLFILDDKGVPSVAKFLQLLPNPTNQPPTATITNPSADVSIQPGQSVTFAGSASDPDGSIARFAWIFPGGNPGKVAADSSNPGTVTVTFPNPGVYTASLTVLDNLGANNPSPPTITVTVGGGGGSALGASITSPASGAMVAGTVTVSMAATNAQGTPTNFLLKLDNATTLSNQSIPSGSTATYAWDTTTTTNGTHTLNLTVTDGAGRTATAAVTLTVSNGGSGPSVSITTPSDGSWTGNSIRVTATATAGGAPLTDVKLYGNGAAFHTQTCTASPCTADKWWSTSALPSGAYQVQAVATDATGAYTVTPPVHIYKNSKTPVIPSGAPAPDTTPPTVSLTSPTEGSTVSGTVTISATATDNINVAAVQFKVDGANVGPEDTTAPYTFAWNTTLAANGSHTVVAIARDAAGNTATSSPVAVMVANADGSAPTVSITAPAGGATVSGTTTVSATATDNVGVLGVQFKVDGANLGAEDTTEPFSVTWDTTTATPGTHTLTAVARDGAGNVTTSAPVTVTVSNGGGGGGDTTPPTVAITTPPNEAWTGNSIRVIAVSSDGVSLATVKLWGNGAVFHTQTCLGTSCTADKWWSTSTLATGAYQIHAVATDSAGNTTISAPVVIYKNGKTPFHPSGATAGDTTPPTASITAPAAGATLSGTTTVTATASDNVGVAGVQFKLDGANLGAELTTAPYSVSWDTTTATNATHTLTAVARDAAGNVFTSAGVTVTVSNSSPDTTPPTVAVSAPAGGSTVSGGVTVSATASDDVGVVGVQFKVDGVNVGAEDTAAPWEITWDTATAGNGTHTITAVARDAAGNVTTSAGVTVTVSNAAPDTTPPAASITAPAGGGTVTGSTTVTADATDDVGVVGVQFKLDGANLGAEVTTAPYSIAWDTATATNGPHSLTAVARDAAGNVTTSAAVSVTVSNSTPDTTSPTVELTAPADGSTVSGAVTVSATASDNVGVVGVQFQLDGVNLGAEVTTAPYSVVWDSGTATPGPHTLTAIARDAAGNATTSVPIGVTVGGGGDAPPAVAISTPPTGVWIGSSVRVVATATDDAGLVSLSLWGNGSAFFTVACSGTSCTADKWWSTSALPNGAYEIQAVAIDSAGHRVMSDVVVVYKNAKTPVVPSGAAGGGGGGDTTPPTVAISGPAEGATVAGGVMLSATASDNVKVVGVQFKVNGVNVGPEDTGAPFTAAWDTTTATNGTYTITAVARDAAGNTATSAPVTVTVANGTGGGPDTTPPAVTITTPFNGDWTGSSIFVSATATDNAGLQGIALYGDGVLFSQATCGGAATCSYGAWWNTSALPSGTHTVTAVATDTAGNATTSATVTINK